MFSPDDSLVATIGNDAAALLWGAHSGTLLHELPVATSSVYAADFSPDGSLLVTAGTFSTEIWDTKSGKLVKTLTGAATLARFGAGGARLLTSDPQRTVKLWDVDAGKPLVTLIGHKDQMRTVELSPDGSRVLTASDDGTAKLWDAGTGKLLTSLDGHSAAVYVARFGADGTVIVTGSRDKTVKIWRRP
jgi:WD40 repeat protein